MWNPDTPGVWSATNLALHEAALWQEDPRTPLDLTWLTESWSDSANFYKALHAYAQRRQGSAFKSVADSRYNFYHDLLVRHKDQAQTALLWFENAQWRRWSYAELTQSVNGLAAVWETTGVQAGEIMVLLHPPGPLWLASLLAAWRLGLSVLILPPQGNAFVQRRLQIIDPRWLAIDVLYRHQLAAVWQERVLPNSLTAAVPSRRPHEYAAAEIAALVLDPTYPDITAPHPLTADSLFCAALRDGILGLGLKSGALCAAPGWHGVESQPALILSVLMCGAGWLEIAWSALEKAPERLLEQPIDVLGISRGLRDLLRCSLLPAKPSWRYWFRHPAEAPDFIHWRDFIQEWQLETVYAGNLLWQAAKGGAILFSPRCRGQVPISVLPAAALSWQLGILNSPDLPEVGGWGPISLGKQVEAEIEWQASPYILAPYQNVWHYLGQYPRGRAGRTYPAQEVLELLAPFQPYLAVVESAVYGADSDPRQILLVFGTKVQATATVLQTLIETELGAEFLPDQIECLPLLPKLDEQGGTDQAWCQQHYLSGELYRRQKNRVFAGLSELKQLILADAG